MTVRNHDGRARRLYDSLRMPRRPMLILTGVILATAAAFAALRATFVIPIDVTWIYYANATIIYGLVGFIAFFMLYSLRRRRPFPASAPKTHFLCLIPAYNESSVIANSVRSLLAQNYPGMLFEVVVVFDGTDDTGQVAQQLGAYVIRTPSPATGKHLALSDAIERLTRPDDHRYVVVFDADNVVSKNFLQRMNDAIQFGGYRCLQGYHDVLNKNANWVTKALWCATSASSRLYNQGRFNSLGNALVCGTGWCCDGALLRKYWPYLRTQTEDIELNGVLLLHEDVRVAWVADARFYDEKPFNVWVAIQQRRRWMAGHMRTFWLLGWPCLREAIRRRSGTLLEMALYYAVPFAMSISVIQLFIIHAGISLDVFRVYGPLASTTAQLALSAVTLLYVLVYQITGFVMENGHIKHGVLYALYTIAFSLIVWTLALVWSWFSLSRRDWIFHTPHVTRAAGVDEALLKTAGEPL